MADEWGYENMWGASPTPYWETDVYAGGSPTFNEAGGAGAWDLSGYGTPNDGTQYSMNINDYTTPAGNWYQDTGQYIGGSDPGAGGGGGSFWGSLGRLLLGAGGAAAGAGGGAGGGSGGLLGPLLSTLGSLGGGAIGSNAANEAARLQSQALNRGIDLQTAQWLQQQQNLAPYLQAGQGGLAQLQQLAGRDAPQLQDPAAAISGANYALPSTTPGWTPQAYQGPQGPNAGDFAWNPQQGPSAAAYRYTPGQTPDAAAYRYTPGAVPTLSGQELLANDPGVAFRMAEGRKALEASAAAKGGLLSGPTLAALQRQGQELSSQEYGNAWNRASQQAQLREGWAQQASSMGFGQAEAASRLREQVNQIASQQGWSQAQAESVFREQMAQQASNQGFNQALAGQQNQFNQGLTAQQWEQKQRQAYETDMYQRMLEQSKLRYGQDVTQNATEYDRAQALYRQRLAQHLLPWEQASTLANLGGQATGMYGSQGGQATSAIANLLGQQGTAQAMGTLGSAGQWNQAISGGVGGVQNILRGLNA